MMTLCLAVSLLCEAASGEAPAAGQSAVAARSVQHANRLDVDALGESFIDDLPSTRGANIALNVRLNDRVRITAREQAQHKFTHGDSRAGGGLIWAARPGFTVRGEALVGINTKILPRLDGNLAADYTRARSQLSGESRFVTFPGARALIVSPSATYWLTDHVGVAGRFHESLTSFDRQQGVVPSSSFHLGGMVRPVTRLQLEAGYGRGIDRIDALSLDQLGRFRAQNITSAARVEVTPLTSVGVRTGRQWFDNGVRMLRLAVSVGRRF
jgi:hypothetical protein